MVPLIFSVLAIAAFVPLAACDWSQKKPETLTAKAGPGLLPTAPHQPFSAPVKPSSGLQTPAEKQEGTTPGTRVGGEKSMRLYGPGVSRKRQTRV